MDNKDIHLERRTFSKPNERLFNHIILASCFDFIPKVLDSDPKVFPSNIVDASIESRFPVQKVEGEAFDVFIKSSEKRQGLQALLQLTDQLYRFLEVGVILPDRSTLSGNVLVDKNGKVWQVDLEDIMDVVSGGLLGVQENIRIELTTERVQNLNADQLAKIQDWDNDYAKRIYHSILLFYKTHEKNMALREKIIWRYSLFTPSEVDADEWNKLSTISLNHVKVFLETLIRL